MPVRPTQGRPCRLPTFLRIPLGTPNLGGPPVTAGGLTFIAAAQDNFLRASRRHPGDHLKVHALNPRRPDLAGTPSGEPDLAGGTDSDEEGP